MTENLGLTRFHNLKHPKFCHFFLVEMLITQDNLWCILTLISVELSVPLTVLISVGGTAATVPSSEITVAVKRQQVRTQAQCKEAGRYAR